MKKKFKKNSYRAHIFRNSTIVFLFTICVFLLGASLGSFLFLHQTVLGLSIETKVLVDLANKSRRSEKISPLTRNSKLDKAAKMKAEDMLANNYFAHFSPDGTTPWYFMTQSGYDFVYAGENLAVNFSDNQSLEDAWMSSVTHRANLLNTNFRDIGMATMKGKYNGQDTIYVVQMFGSESTLRPQVPTTSDIRVIAESKNFISAKNLSNLSAQNNSKVLGVETYSSWWEKLIYNFPFYTQIFYVIIIFLFTAILSLRALVEYRRHHYRHFIVSIVFLLLLLMIASFNQNFINFF